MALLGLAPHRAQGRGGELALDVLHDRPRLPSRCLCAVPRALFLQQLLSKNFVRRLCAATTVCVRGGLYVCNTTCC